MKKGGIFWGTMVILACFFAGCGYRFSGGGSLPAGIRSLEVPVFANKTGQSGAEVIFTKAFIRELSRHPGLKLAPESAGDARMLGEIARVRVLTASRRDSQSVLERRIFVTVKAVLKRADGSIAWSAADLSENEVYSVNENKLVTEDNRNKALEKIADKIAEQIMFSATSDF